MAEEEKLKKTLGFWAVLALSISSIMGTGLFFGAAIGAKYAGNAVIISWAILTLVSIYIAACFGELSALFPKTGGVYEFSKQAYGRFSSFVIGWIAWLAGNIANTIMVIAAVNYLFDLPAFSQYSSFWIKIAISVFLILLLNLVVLLGAELGAVVLIFFVGMTVSVVVALSFKGLSLVHTSNILPIFTNNSIFLAVPGIFIAIFFLIETFFGWEGATYLAEETKEPEKVMPKAIILGTVIVAVLGFMLIFVLLGAYGPALQKTQDPVNQLAHSSFGELGGNLIGITIFLVLIGSAASGFFAMPRLVMALARDKLFLSQFSAIHPKFKTPHKAIFFQIAITIIMLGMGFGSYNVLLSLLVPLGATLYIFVMLALPILRFKMPNLQRPFKAPLGKILPFAVIAFFLMVIFMWAQKEQSAVDLLKLSGSFVLFAFPLYFLVELYYDPKMITDVHDLFSYFTLLTERISLPAHVRKEIMKLIGDVKGKSVLEFGCSVGTLTIPLLEAAGPNGTVYATDFSKNDLKITKKRVETKSWESEGRIYGRISILHDFEHMSRLHPEITYADAAVSVGVLGYLQDVKKVLKEVRDILPAEGKICFVEYGDFFHMIPNVEWLSKNSIIENVFRDCGFSVQVIRKKGLFWNYIFIYGMKYGEDVAYI